MRQTDMDINWQVNVKSPSDRGRIAYAARIIKAPSSDKARELARRLLDTQFDAYVITSIHPFDNAQDKKKGA